MSVGDRILVVIGVLAMTLVVAGAGTAAWLAHGYGTFEMEVRSHDPGRADVSIRVPGALVRVAAAFIPTEARREAGREIAKWSPVAKAALSELRRCPDARLVDVKSAGETVRITKRGGTLLAEVSSRQESVRVSIPLGVAEAVVENLGEAEGAP